MQKHFLLSIGLFFTSMSIFAQNSELFTVVAQSTTTKMNSNQKEVTDKTKNDPFLKQMDVVKVGDISKLQQNGELTFTLPRYGKVTAKATRIESYGVDNYKWLGEIKGEGYVILYNQNGNISGHITVGNSSYQIKALGDASSVLAEMDTKKMAGKFCGGNGALKDNKDTPKSTSSNRVVPCSQLDRIRVLVVYTQRALNAVGLQVIRDRVNISIDQFNEAYRISGVANARVQLELVGVEQTNFVETTGGGTVGGIPINSGGVPVEQDDIRRLPNNVEARRVTTNADIVVCLVDAGYTFSRGIARAINAQYADGYASCEIRSIPDQPVFPHEVGHLLGGRHDFATDVTPGDAHGYEFVVKFGFLNLGRKTYCTHMCPEKPSSTLRSWRWSNPNISDSGTPTGTTASHNVARVVNANADRIANFRPAVTTLNAAISGESYVTTYGTKTYEPLVSCTAGPYTYLWERSYDGFNYFSASSSELYSFTIYPSNKYNIYLRLRVTANGQTATAFYTIQIPNGGGARVGVADSSSVVTTDLENTITENTEVDASKLIQVIYPNPTDNQASVKIYVPERQAVTLTILGALGQEIKTVHQGELDKGVHNFNISTQNFTAGQYFVRATIARQSESIKIIVHK